MAGRLDMSAQVLHRRADTIECWDDDPDFAELDQIQKPHTSTSSRAGTEHSRRESAVSSRRSTITSTYDIDALEVADREHQIPFDGTPAAAIKSAQSAGIPIPENVPLSALVGGTIKRLGPSKRAKKVTMNDDWGEDLELPMGNSFTVKRKEFPDSLQHLPASKQLIRNFSPPRVNLAPVSNANSQLNKFRDTFEDDNFFGDCEELPTLKVFQAGRPTQVRRPAAPILPTPPLSESASKRSPLVADDDFENDFEFPTDAPLQLGVKAGERHKVLDVQPMDVGFEDWGDGDSGIGSSHYTGTRGGMEHGPHSVISPSMSAMESEDDMPLDGLVLPDGMLLDFQRALERRRQAVAAAPPDDTPEFHAQKDSDDPANEEFFEGIEIGEGEVFDSKKLSLNRNVRQKQQRKPSPIRRTAMSLTFTTNKPTPHQPPPRNRLQNHPTLLPSAPLEPVAERENQHQPPVKRNPRNRWSGDYKWPGDAQQSRTERPRVGTKSTRNLRGENAPPTTTHAQLLRAKRSMPNINEKQNQPKSRPPSRTSNGRPSSRNSTGRPPSSGNPAVRPTSSGSRPPSSGGNGGRPASRTSSGRPPSRNETHSSRPKTPHSNIGVVRHPAPFLPGGGAARNSHHVAAKPPKSNLGDREPASSSSSNPRSSSRTQQRTTPRHSPSSSGASNTTKKGTTPTVAPEHLRREAASIGTLTQPTRKRNFGDGTELETFDDLPTSAKIENRFTVAPVARGAPKAARPKSVPNREGESPKKKKQQHDLTPRQEDIPRFARDTNASRKARELTQQRLGMTTPPSPNAERWRSKIAARNQTTPRAHVRKNSQQKPHLIKPMGNINTLPKEAAANGMVYNPRTFRWEGNGKELRIFDTPENRTPPRPALITKVNQSGSKMGIQVVGGMVFDPSRMCWLKVDEDPEDEGDPFEGLEDLPEDLMSVDGQSIAGGQTTSNSVVMGGVGSAFGGSGRISGGFGEFVVGEEFDVGPEFVRRQREEEDRWRRGTEGWITGDIATKWENRYLLRELLAEQQR